MKMKKISLEKRKEYITSLKEEISRQLEIIEMIETYKPRTLNDRILLEYAIEGSVSSVATKLNEEGLRIDGRKYISNDISDVIKQKPVDEFHQMVRKAFEHNKAGLRY